MAPVLLARVDKTIYSLAQEGPCHPVLGTFVRQPSPECPWCRLVVCGPCLFAWYKPSYSGNVQGGDQGPLPPEKGPIAIKVFWFLRPGNNKFST